MAERACLILLNGGIPDPALVRKTARLCRGVIACDGGLRHARPLGLEPDFVVGDMDSLPRVLPPLKRALYWCDFDENRSDFEKGLAFAKDLGCREAYVAGALGGSADHALVNLAVVERWSRSLKIVVLDCGTIEMLGPGRRVVPLKKGARFSLLAAACGAVVTLRGARYALKRATLEPGSRGLGNTALGPVDLTVHKGRLWLMSA